MVHNMFCEPIFIELNFFDYFFFRKLNFNLIFFEPNSFSNRFFFEYFSIRDYCVEPRVSNRKLLNDHLSSLESIELTAFAIREKTVPNCNYTDFNRVFVLPIQYQNNAMQCIKPAYDYCHKGIINQQRRLALI